MSTSSLDIPSSFVALWCRYDMVGKEGRWEAPRKGFIAMDRMTPIINLLAVTFENRLHS